MKKFYLFAAFALLVSVFSNSANFITLGDGDSVRIPPRYSDGYYKMTAKMHIEGMVDSWVINTTFPEGLTVKLVSGIVPLEGLSISYTDRFGESQVYQAPLQASAAYATISSDISVMGYWDYDGDSYYDSYGTAKWLPGDYDMFSLNFYVHPDFRNGLIIFDGILSSGPDQRGAVLQGVRFHKEIYAWIGYLPGDMNGDDRLTITDVSMMIDYLLNPADFDCWQAQAADYNQDGNATIKDVTDLINYLLSR